MAKLVILNRLSKLLLLLQSIPFISSQTFPECLHSHTSNNTNFLLYTPNSPLYTATLRQSMQNLRFTSISNPSFILLPTHPSHVSSAILCCRLHHLRISIRSGGHDYEGLSYRSQVPFLLLDLANMNTIHVDATRASAWVGAGSTLGELYYNVATKAPSLGFPAGLCPQVGVGGLIGGGGIGTIMRKHGLAADNVVDAVLVDAEGHVHDRSSMGEDLFWAIRGGGAASFGIVLLWELRLVPVPAKVTTFAIYRTMEQGAVGLINQWQTIAPDLPEDLFLRIVIRRTAATGGDLAAKFHALFLGRCEDLVQIMGQRFPVLGMGAKDCIEMSWVQSTLYFAGHRPQQPLEALLRRGSSTPKGYFKGRSDFVVEPISVKVLEELWGKAAEEDGSGMVIMDPFGGKMGSISEAELPFPHRKGVLYNVQYLVQWQAVGEGERHMRWVEGLYELMGPYASKGPRRAYLNYRDLGLGSEGYWGETGWGRSYFVGNAVRLARVKTRVDPTDFFRSEQSVPPML